MASMAVVARTSNLVAASPALCPSSVSATGSGVVSSSTLALKRSFNGEALRASRIRNVRRSAVDTLVVRATSSSEDSRADVSKQFDDLLADVKIKWDSVENKSALSVYVGGAFITLWLSSTVIGAVNSVPLLPKLLELVGLGYTGWFVYRYLLFKSSRKELVSDIEELKGKITGATGSVTESVTGKEEK